MGSHGGGTAEGQRALLAHLGVTADTVGAPVQATMDVVRLGEVTGLPIYLDRLAYEADGIVLVNRVKPHTDFVGAVESGPLKMLAVGLGNQIGAEHYHRAGIDRGLGEVILAVARTLLARTTVVFAVAVVESQEHQLSALQLAAPAELEETEGRLLAFARGVLPLLPLDEIDLLIVDEMGKDVSGSGLDPNVVGRVSASWMTPRPRPRISRIYVRSLTTASEGNAIGLGMVDAISAQFAQAIDLQATRVNAFTSCSPEDAKVPIAFETDRQAVEALLATIRLWTPGDLRVARIRNTLETSPLLVSEPCLADLARPGVVIESREHELVFDAEGNLPPLPWTSST